MKLCVVDTQGPGQAEAQRRAQLAAAQKVQPTMRVAAPRQRQSLQAPRMATAPVQLTPDQIARLRAAQMARAKALVPSHVIPGAPRSR